jgi:hypothetical protein
MQGLCPVSLPTTWPVNFEERAKPLTGCYPALQSGIGTAITRKAQAGPGMITAGRISMRRVTVPLLAALALITTFGSSAAPVPALAAGRPHQAVRAAKVSNVPLLGVTASRTKQLKRDIAEFGQLPIIHVFSRRIPRSWRWGVLRAVKSAILISFNAPPSKIISGADNAALAHFFDTAPAGRLVYWNYFHEPENNIAKGQFTAAAFRAAWDHIDVIARAAHNPDLKATLILMAYDLRRGAHRDWKDYYPGNADVDVFGWDSYPRGSANGSRHPQATPPAVFLGPAIAVSKSMGKPFGFGEFGLNTTARRGPWLTSVGKYLLASGAAFATMFDGPAGRLKVTDGPSIAAWRAIVARSASASGKQRHDHFRITM